MEISNGGFSESGLSSEDSQQYHEVISTIDLLKEMKDLNDKLPENLFDLQVKINELERMASALKEKDTTEKKPVIELRKKNAELAEIKDSLEEQIKQKKDEQQNVEAGMMKVPKHIKQIEDEIAQFLEQGSKGALDSQSN